MTRLSLSIVPLLALLSCTEPTNKAQDTFGIDSEALGGAQLATPTLPSAHSLDAGRAFGRVDDGYRFHAGGFLAQFEKQDVVLTSLKNSDSIRLRFTAWGRGTDLNAVATTAPIALPSKDGAIRTLRADLEELDLWWQGSGHAVQQGWTLHSPPDGSGVIGLVVEIDDAWVSTDGERAWLQTEGASWNVEGLAAWDANDKPLDAWMEVDGMDLVIRVDDTDAVYPVTVDPWYSTYGTDIQHGSTQSGSYHFSNLTSDRCGDNDCNNSRFAERVHRMEDLDGDGYEELFVASDDWYLKDNSNNNYRYGRAFIFYGSATGISSNYGWSVKGDEDDYYASGYVLDADFNGDGNIDLAVGADRDDPNGSNSGSVYIYPGSASGILGTSTTTITGNQSDDYYGAWRRIDAGDFDADGFDDLVIGVPYDDTTASNAGKVVVHDGQSSGYVNSSASATLYGEAQDDEYGQRISVGDFDGDGFDDLVVAAPYNDDTDTNSGKLYFYYGSASGLSTTASGHQYGGSYNYYYGQNMTVLGDLDDDGYDDFVSRGRLYLGTANGIQGAANQSWSNSEFYPMGDATGDGFDDFVTDYHFYSGSATASMTSELSSSYLQTAADLDGDGFEDTIFGEPGWSSSRGRLWVRYAYEPDADLDGYLESEDCDDNDATVYPNAEEVVGDGIDNDCDGNETCYADADGDGYAADDGSTVASTDTDCSDAGEADDSVPRTDCDDTTALAKPGGIELAGDGIDQDCDGADLCYADVDGDGYRSSTGGTVASTDMDCTDAGEATSTAPATDCDDTNSNVNPSATETPANGIDDDCNGTEVCYVDLDDDGYSNTSGATVASTDMDCADSGEGASNEPTTDCDDNDAAINPGAPEIILDGIDQDCDGGDGCYADEDLDGYAASDGSTVLTTDNDCNDSGEADSTVPQTDCDDSDANINPTAGETIGDEIDYDCDGTEACYADADSDGYRDSSGGTVSSEDTDCSDEGEATASADADDCDDNDDTIYPGAEDSDYDGIDSDCDDSELCLYDADSDGYAAEGAVDQQSTDGDCTDTNEAPATEEWDCDDADASIYPTATEIVVDGIDQDCDGGDACYADLDEDGYRDATGATVISEDGDCLDEGEADATVPATDCDDNDADVNPAQTDYPADGVDSDCDGYELCYEDGDDDGYRTTTGSTVYSDDTDCTGEGEAVAGDPATDCDDADASVYPNASEIIGDEVDQDCDGSEICYIDADEDLYWEASGSTVSSEDADCADLGEAPSSEPGGDCDDTDPNVNPAATETVADAVDNDCDGYEECYTDADSDGFADETGSNTTLSEDLDCVDPGEANAGVPQTDCNDNDGNAYPGADEIAGNGVDNDCDGEELCLIDADGDGHVETTGATVVSSDVTCTSEGLATSDMPIDDCDDTDVAIFPGAAESVADGVDQNCDSIELCYLDADGDGARAADGSTIESPDMSCSEEGETDANADLDCNDEDASIHPAAEETPMDSIDSDCDGAELCYPDFDSDGYRPDDPLPSFGDLYCTGVGLVGASTPAGDCNDQDPTVSPVGVEIAVDGVDQDCDGTELCYVDSDSDGYRPESGATTQSESIECSGDGVVGADGKTGDCNDEDADINPEEAERYGDGVDSDCDGVEYCYADLDGDGYRTSELIQSIDLDCDDVGEAMADAPLVDCDDLLAAVNPAAEEIKDDGIDQDCDGLDGTGRCSSIPQKDSLVMLGLALGLMIRRRRRSA